MVDSGVVGLSQPARCLGSLLRRRLYRRTRGALRAHFDTVLRADPIDNQGRRCRGSSPLSSQGFSLDLYRFAIHHARRRQRDLWVRFSHAITAASQFRVAFHTAEDLHFVSVVAGLGGTTEQMHFSAA
jgi:hypothetical protein